jgi:thiol-disulfide isomerase/thioredoxin
MMRKQLLKYTLLSATIFLFIFFLQPAYGENKIKTGMDFPDITLEGADCVKANQYLGVENDERYLDLSKIPAKLIIIEFFNVYCPVCQMQASVANKLYKIIQRNPDLNKDVKMIAIGIGNRQDEIDAYKKQHTVKFPLFIDPYSKSQNKHGIGMVPYTLIINADRKVLDTHMGVIENLDGFVEKILMYSKQK